MALYYLRAPYTCDLVTHWHGSHQKGLTPTLVKKCEVYLNELKESELSNDEEASRVAEKSAEGKEVEALRVPEYKPRIPYQAKLKKEKQEEKFNMFLDMFKTLLINVPFVELLSQIPLFQTFERITHYQEEIGVSVHSNTQ